MLKITKLDNNNILIKIHFFAAKNHISVIFANL
jgi:hypothetical protein